MRREEKENEKNVFCFLEKGKRNVEKGFLIQKENLICKYVSVISQ